MPTNQQGSKLQQYTQNYGQRLQSLLVPEVAVPGPVTDTTSVLGRPATAQAPAPQRSMMVPPPQQGPTPDQQMLDEGEGKQGTSARKLFQDMPSEEQQKQAKDLEDALAKGGQSVDQAYDELIKQMGTRPDEGLSKEEKSMLLIEFGLNLMSQSAAGRHGGDLGGAVGDAGLSSLDSYQRTKGGRARAWDSQRSALETGRVKDKLDQSLLATKSEIEEDARIPGKTNAAKPDRYRFIGGDGYMWETVDGETSRMTDGEGKPVKAKPDSSIENQRLKDAPQTDAEIDAKARENADDYLRYHADTYRDLNPQQLEAERDRLIEKERKGLTKARGGAEAPPKNTSQLGPLKPSGSAFADFTPKNPPADALVAGKARRIKGFEGRWTLVNGKPVRVD